MDHVFQAPHATGNEIAMRMSILSIEANLMKYNRLSVPTLTWLRVSLMSNSCKDRPYGYYADMKADCQVFHICSPIVHPDGFKQNLKHR